MKWYIVIALVAIAGLGVAGWTLVRERQDHMCTACQRPIHESSRTVATVDGNKRGFCCPSCAISQHHQTGKRVDIVSLTDFDRGTTLEPGSAYLVRGSDVNSCSHGAPAAAIGIDKQPVESHFDRCSPSLLAFRDKGAAERFARQHGGQVLTYADVRN